MRAGRRSPNACAVEMMMRRRRPRRAAGGERRSKTLPCRASLVASVVASVMVLVPLLVLPLLALMMLGAASPRLGRAGDERRGGCLRRMLGAASDVNDAATPAPWMMDDAAYARAVEEMNDAATPAPRLIDGAA